MTEETAGREPVQVVEILQPLCENNYGLAPCTASGSADERCYNTYATCQDKVNYSLGTPLSLYFSRGRVADMQVSDVAYMIPSLVSVSTSPTMINLANASLDAKGLGTRALCSLTFKDHAHTDRVVDQHVDARSWNPMSADRGSFWSRWIARNKYRQNIQIKVYEGYAGEALADMNVRTYFMQSISGPNSSGVVTITGKDILTRIEERKAQAPIASPGLLYTGIDNAVTSFEVANAVEDDYPASGTLRIENECMTYTGRATSTNGITFTGVTRGTDGTSAEAHETDDTVQECLRYTAARLDDIVEDLLTTYGGIDSSWLATAAWATEFDNYLSFYTLSCLITEPESVTALISQLQEQCLFYIWWDERDAQIYLKAIRGVDDEPATITSEEHIISGSFSITEKPRERVSQLWTFYSIIDPTKSRSDVKNYQSTFVLADLGSESDNQYGEASIRKMYARWITQDTLAQNTANKLVNRYVDVPRQATFRLDAKDRQHWIGDNIYISHYLDVDEYGQRKLCQWTILSAEEVVPGEVVEYVAEDTTLYGNIYYILGSGAGDYPGVGSADFGACYIGDADGLLSDGNNSGAIS